MNYSHCLFNNSGSSTVEQQATIPPTDTIKVASGLYAFCMPRLTPDFTTTPFYIGVDEAGRGPLISRVYTGAVILPDPATTDGNGMDFSQIRDSKKLTTKKIHELAAYIKEHAVAWSVAWEDERTIDQINILEATQRAMHKAIAGCLAMLRDKGLLGGDVPGQQTPTTPPIHFIIDGNRFNAYPHASVPFPYHYPHNGGLKASDVKTQINAMGNYSYTTVEGGDNIYSNIAAASILAKSAHDTFIIGELCQTDPSLITKYALDQNVGYGSKRHMDGIRAYGISLWHRRTFGICKLYADPTTAPALDMSLRETLAQQDAALLAARAPKVKPPKEPKPRKNKVTINKEAALAELDATLAEFVGTLSLLLTTTTTQ